MCVACIFSSIDRFVNKIDAETRVGKSKIKVFCSHNTIFFLSTQFENLDEIQRMNWKRKPEPGKANFRKKWNFGRKMDFFIYPFYRWFIWEGRLKTVVLLRCKLSKIKVYLQFNRYANVILPYVFIALMGVLI